MRRRGPDEPEAARRVAHRTCAGAKAQPSNGNCRLPSVGPRGVSLYGYDLGYAAE